MENVQIVTTPQNKQYKNSIRTGLHYDIETPDAVISVIDAAYKNKNRVRLYLGDVKTGETWLEEYDIMGTVSGTTGIKSPILVNNSRSWGGGLILTHCIVGIQDTKTKRFLYKHPTFKVPDMWLCSADMSLKMEGYTTMVYALRKDKKENVANFRTEERAKRYIQFMKGERMAK